MQVARARLFAANYRQSAGLLLVQKRENRLDASHSYACCVDGSGGSLAQSILPGGRRAACTRRRPYYAPKGPAQYVLEMNVLHLPDFGVGDAGPAEVSSWTARVDLG